MSPTVGEYFQQRLGERLDAHDELNADKRWSPYHPAFTVETGCGRDCKAAIDAAAAFLGQHRRAFGTTREAEARVLVSFARAVVRSYVHG